MKYTYANHPHVRGTIISLTFFDCMRTPHVMRSLWLTFLYLPGIVYLDYQLFTFICFLPIYTCIAPGGLVRPRGVSNSVFTLITKRRVFCG
jgi:hypothetical protein